MKWIIAGVAALALVGCDNTSNAPFSLNWGQTIDSVNFIKAGDCKANGSKTICTFGAQKPFNDWSYENQLVFEGNNLSQVVTTIVGVEDYALPKPNFDNFKQKLNSEISYLVAKGFNKETADSVNNKCQSEASCDKVGESSQTSLGMSNLWVTINPTPIAIVTFTPQ
ncbi:hypothetical protein [Providencia sp.]|uniref:hypothetical protein n=1 Tax=Providencia sp. TaxID=589 RepID=UPI001B72AD7D|nr:hypothetical protein [Providencia sp.]MBP6123810.1 hypothetical protein [Providencia sp.]